MASRRIQTVALLALLQTAAIYSPLSAQDQGKEAGRPLRLVSRDEGEAIARTALQHWPQLHDKPDCSHLAHDVYTVAGLDYVYATTNDVFDGIEGFERVTKPQAGDLVVWRGHMGIVIDPEDESFYSSVISGISVSNFSSSYWESRGPRRFYRYQIAEAQAARLLELASNGKPHSTAVAGQATHKVSSVSNKKDLEDEGSDAEPGFYGDSGPAPVNRKGVGRTVVAGVRRPTKEEIGSAFEKLSDTNAAQLYQSAALDGPTQIVDGFETGKIETQGSSGWVELKIKTIAVSADGRMTAANRTARVRFNLLRQVDGWTLRQPANSFYVLRPTAVRMITTRLAELARSHANAKDLKPLTRALGILVADGDI
jgi:NlpC/P60 family